MLMNDGSAKTLMVDERQNVREVLENLFEKTHCDCNVDWSLCETNHELQLGQYVASCTKRPLCKHGRDMSVITAHIQSALWNITYQGQSSPFYILPQSMTS